MMQDQEAVKKKKLDSLKNSQREYKKINKELSVHNAALRKEMAANRCSWATEQTRLEKALERASTSQQEKKVSEQVKEREEKVRLCMSSSA